MLHIIESIKDMYMKLSGTKEELVSFAFFHFQTSVFFFWSDKGPQKKFSGTQRTNLELFLNLHQVLSLKVLKICLFDVFIQLSSISNRGFESLFKWHDNQLLQTVSKLGKGNWSKICFVWVRFLDSFTSNLKLAIDK